MKLKNSEKLDSGTKEIKRPPIYISIEDNHVKCDHSYIIYIYGHAPPQNQPFNKNTGISHIKCSFSVYFFGKHFLIKNFRRKKGNTTNVKNKTIESKNKKQKSSFGFWFLRKPKTKKDPKKNRPNRPDPKPKTKNQNFGFGFWFFRKPKTKKQKNQTQQGKPKTKIWVLVTKKPKKNQTQQGKPKTKIWVLVFGFSENQKPKKTKNMPLLVLVWPVGYVFLVFWFLVF